MFNTLVVAWAQRLSDIQKKFEAANLSGKNTNYLTEMIADISRIVPDALIKLHDAYNNNVKDIRDGVCKIELYSKKIDELEAQEKSKKENLTQTKEKLETRRTTTGILKAATGAGAIGLGAAAIAVPAVVAVAPVAFTAAGLTIATGLGLHVYNKFTDSEYVS